MADPIPHFYGDIPGWFDFHDVYRTLAQDVPDGGHIVEVGGWKGRSSAYMAVELANSGKRIRFDVVDTWEGSPDEGRHQDDPDVRAGRLYETFLANIAPVREYVRPVRMASVEAARTYADGSLDAVFIDGAHDTTSVLQDCAAWWPKVRPGGLLAGHDSDDTHVQRAVKAFAQWAGVRDRKVSIRSWAALKPIPETDWTVPSESRALYVAVCSNERNVYRQTVKSLWKNFFGQTVTHALAAHGWQDAEPDYIDHYPSVAAQRDYAMLAAIKAGASHVLFLDADMTWTKDHSLLYKMLPHHSIGIVSGVYHLKTWPYWPVVFDRPTLNEKTRLVDYHYAREQMASGEMFRVDLIGMGCALVPVKAAQAIGVRPWFEYMPDNFGLPAITEDVAFCARVRAIGCPIWVDPSIECGHIAQQEITRPWWDRAMVEKDVYDQMREEAEAKGETLPHRPTEASITDARTRAAQQIREHDAWRAARDARHGGQAQGSIA
jgi:GT2 family glycosyltransferase